MDSLIPEGCEAWAEQRRTGYPRLFPVRYNHSRTDVLIRKLWYAASTSPAHLQTEDPDQYLALVETLGDPDDGGTRFGGM